MPSFTASPTSSGGSHDDARARTVLRHARLHRPAGQSGDQGARSTRNWTNKPDKGEFGSSKDLDQITAWWTQWPSACVGLRTGKINGFVVVDVDRHGVSDGFKTIKTFDGVDQKKTATILSAGGGQHLYFSYAGELKSTTLGEGVDFLAESRMVIAPGSVRADGRPYMFVNGHDLFGWRRCPARSWQS